jgi:GNAT superfamily N-acetyltransferase
MAPTFQKAKPEDRGLVLEMMREYYAFDHLTLDERAARAALEQILADERNGRVWLIKDGETVAGYAVLALGFSLEYHGREAFIDELYLKEEFRGKGFGRRALEFLEDRCRKPGVKALHLEVERENEKARGVYLKNGFTDNERFLMTKRIEEKK